MATIDSITTFLDTLVGSTSTFTLREISAIRPGRVTADGAVFPDFTVVTRSRPDLANNMSQTSVWDQLRHVKAQARRDQLRIDLLPTSEMIDALRRVLAVAQNMGGEWQAEIVEAITEALVDYLPGERDRRDAAYGP